MKTNHESVEAAPGAWRFQGWIVCGAALISFAAGSLITARLTYPKRVSADNDRVFELLVYHTVPGRVPGLESIFRDVSRLQSKHDLNVVGYWVPGDKDPAWANTFIYLVAHSSREEAGKNWHALHADPAFPEYRKQAGEIIEKADKDYRVDDV